MSVFFIEMLIYDPAGALADSFVGLVNGADLYSTPALQTNGTVIESAGATTLVAAIDNTYLMQATDSSGPTLQFNGSAVAPSTFASTLGAPIGAEIETSGRYEVAWKNTTTGLYSVWLTDAGGAHIATVIDNVTSINLTLEQAEAGFHQDLNGDGTIGIPGTVVESFGATTLVENPNGTFNLEANDGTGPLLKVGGAPVGDPAALSPGTPVAAEIQASGSYLVAFTDGTTAFTFWNVDARGNYAGTPYDFNISGTSITVEDLEQNFHQDLNGDGVIGLSGTAIESAGATTLLLVSGTYALEGSDHSGPALQNNGNAVTAGLFSSTIGSPIGAEALSSGGYKVAWKNETTGLFTIWYTDAFGNHSSTPLSGAAGTSAILESFETSFQQDLNGDGSIGEVGTVIESFGSTALLSQGENFILQGSGGTGPTLQFGGAPVTVGAFGGTVTPVGAEATTSGGYLFAWKVVGTSNYVIWNTDAAGNYQSYVGPLAGNSLTLEQYETAFHQDLNGDGTVGPTITPLESFGATTLEQVGNTYVMANSGGTGQTLQFGGAPVTVGAFGGTVTPVGAEAVSSGGYLFAWQLVGTSNYIIWNTDAAGNYQSYVGVLSSQSFTLQQYETAFHQDLNGDARLSTVVDLGTNGADNRDLTSQTAVTTVNLSSNTAQVSDGLNQPSLTFIGAPDAITLRTAGATIEYALAPSSGIETIANFTLGRDELNIDLLGSASSVLQAFDNTASHAIAIFSSADRTHGIVLLNVPTGETAASLLSSSHTTFIDGHALIG